MTKIYGANIYTEHVQQALDHDSIQTFITGRFMMEASFDDQQNPTLVCRIELNSQTKPSEQLAVNIQSTFVEQVKMINSEYNYVLNQMGDRVKPKIILHEHGDAQFFPTDKIKKTS